MERGGAATVLADDDLGPERLSGAVGAILDDPAALERMSAAARALAKPDAAARIADEVLAAAASSGRSRRLRPTFVTQRVTKVGGSGMSRDWGSRRLHFVGIGGAGMSGLAIVAAGLGAEVTGSDRAESSYMERLRVAGLEPIVGHDAANLPEGAEVVVSSAIGADNPELALARERGIEPIHRGELLAQLCAEKRLIAVAGTHGKTTTTAMIVWALRGLGEDPAFFVGGEVPRLGPDGAAANAGWGDERVGGGRGRRVRRQLPAPRSRDRRRHQRRDGPPLEMGLAGATGRRLRGVRREGRAAPSSRLRAAPR